MTIEREILRELKGRADHYKAGNVLYLSYWRSLRWNKTPRYIVYLSQKFSISARYKTHKNIKRFIKRYRRDAAADAEHQLNLQDELPKYMQHLDQLFFFGLLTRQVRKSGLLGGREPLVELKLRETCNGKSSAVAEWQTKNHRIEMFTQFYEPPLPPQDFGLDELVSTLAHEMVHAYLDIFSQSRTREFEIDVEESEGHGPMFWELYLTIMSRLRDWVPESAAFVDDGEEAEAQLAEAYRT